MQTKSGNRSAKPQGAGRNPAKGRKSKRRISERRVSGRAGRGAANAPATSTVIPNFLNPGFGEVDPFIINAPQAFQGDYYDDHSLGSMNEWVIALYKCLKHHPNFKDDKVWPEFPAVSELARYLIAEVQKINVNNFSWSFAKDRNKETYQLIYFRQLTKYEDSFQLPLEWLPKLEEESEELYDLVMTTLARIAQYCHLDVIDNEYNDFIIQDPEANMQGDFPDDDIFRVQIAQYNKGGVAFNFKQTLKRYFYKMSIDDLKKKIKKFKFKGEKQISIILWLEMGLDVIKNPASIGMFYFPDDRIYNDGNPITANDCFNYLWSFRDMVQTRAESVMNDTASNSGIIGPTISKVYTPKGIQKEGGTEKQIELLANFMDAGRKIYMEHYDQLFIDYYKIENQEQLLFPSDDQG